jgi:hypothetical protein
VVLPGIISNVAFNQGRIFHVRADGTLLAQDFDFKRLLEPKIEVVAKPVGYDGQFNYAAFSVSRRARSRTRREPDPRATS